MANTVLLDIQDHVATLTLNRPDALNALSVEMMQDLCEVARQLQKAQDVAVVVVTGAGAHFMAGGDLRDFSRHLNQSPDDRLATFKAIVAQYVNPAVEMLRALPMPVVAKVRGACAGFGLSLMLGCDLAVASDNAVFTTAYSSIGLSGDGGMSWLLPRLVGIRRATEMLLLAERFNAADALELGMINRCVPADTLDAEVDKLVARLKAGPRHAQGEIKRLLAESWRNELDSQLQSEAEAFGRCSAQQDFVEGITAFLEKRKPAFGG